jgi:VanZ family protein
VSPVSTPPQRPSWPARVAGIATGGYVGVLLFATHYPKPQEFLGGNPPSDKTLHLVAYGLLGLFVGTTLLLAGRWSRRTMLLAAVSLILFAALDEATQPLPWFRRAADPLDWVFDCLGIAIGLAAVAVAARALAAPQAGRSQPLSSSASERGTRRS